jgi:hypothetical protein
MGYILLHLGLMVVDWQLRDPTQNTQPMPGGIPDALLSTLLWGSLGIWTLAIFFVMPRTWAVWVRVLLALLQGGLALVLMVGGWLHYVIYWGIDTL